MNGFTMTCDMFEARLGEFLEGGLDDHTREAYERHRAGCARCAALVADLDGIVQAARSLPLPTPARDLWPDIAARLETPVVALPTASPAASPAHAAGRAPVTITWRRLAIAATVLVTLSAGVTWNLARRAPADATLAVTDTPRADSAVSPVAEPPRDALTGSSDAPPSLLGGPLTGGTQGGVVASAPGSNGTAVLASNGTRPLALDTLYGREIANLHTVVDEQLGLLDSATVTVIRRNLSIIDEAIRESRAALARDPNSGFLFDQLDRAYERKIDLLRRVALL